MSTTFEDAVQTINITREALIEASPEITFESILEELGPGSVMPDGRPLAMRIEPWPGGRWFRDLGDNAGHLWGHVQVIKPPALLELRGPMFMSYPAINFVQYRLTAEGQQTRLAFTHRALGLIPDDHRQGVVTGWEHGLKRIQQLAQQRKSQANGR